MNKLPLARLPSSLISSVSALDNHVHVHNNSDLVMPPSPLKILPHVDEDELEEHAGGKKSPVEFTTHSL